MGAGAHAVLQACLALLLLGLFVLRQSRESTAAGREAHG
jgi:hypothetical protein